MISKVSKLFYALFQNSMRLLGVAKYNAGILSGSTKDSF
jgi:hypothetical protein